MTGAAAYSSCRFLLFLRKMFPRYVPGVPTSPICVFSLRISARISGGDASHRKLPRASLAARRPVSFRSSAREKQTIVRGD